MRAAVMVVAMSLWMLGAVAPVASAAAAKRPKVTIKASGTVAPGRDVTFRATVKLTKKHRLKRYVLSFGDKTASVRGTKRRTRFVHRFRRAGTYTVRLTVTDNRGLKGVARLRLRVAAPAPPATPLPAPRSPNLPPKPPSTPPIDADAAPVVVTVGGSVDVATPAALAEITSLDPQPASDVTARVVDRHLAVAASAGAARRSLTLSLRGVGCTDRGCDRAFVVRVPVTVITAAAPSGALNAFTSASPDRVAAAEAVAGGGTRLVDELVIVVGTDDVVGTRAQAEAAAAAVGGFVSGGLEDVGIYQVRWDAAQDLQARRTALLAQPGVVSVTDNLYGAAESQAPPSDWNDDGEAATWPFTQVRAEQAWAKTKGSNVRVGILDAGNVYDAHEDLDVIATLSTDSVGDHATHVAGLACAKQNGVGLVGMAWGCPIVSSGRGDNSTTGLLGAAETLAKYPDVKVINMSLGRGSGCISAKDASDQATWAKDNRGAFRKIFTSKTGSGIVWTISAGNNCAPGVGSPQAANFDLANVIVVGSTNNGGALSTFSNFGFGVEVVAPGGVGAGIAGGGGGVWSDYVVKCGFLWRNLCGTYTQMYGTSMAAPEVAGIAALVRSAHSDFSADKVAGCITDSAGAKTGIATMRGVEPAAFSPQVAYTPTTLPIVDAEAAVACAGRPATGRTKILLVGQGDDTHGSGAAQLATVLGNAGYAVTRATDVPADLSPYGQVWRIDYHGFDAATQNRLLQYARGGGSLFLTGEHEGYDSDLNASDRPIVNGLIVAVGGIQVGGQGTFGSGGVPYTIKVNADVTSSLAHSPFELSTFTVTAAGGLGNVPSRNVFARSDSGVPVAAAWDTPDVVGGGRLMVVMDVNWFTPDFTGANWEKVATNFARFLSGSAGMPDPQPQPVRFDTTTRPAKPAASRSGTSPANVP